VVEPVDGSARVGIEFKVQDGGQRVAVARPSAAACHEEPRLVCTGRGIGDGEMVGTSDHAYVAGALVLSRELRVGVVVSLGSLHIGKTRTHVPLLPPVNGPLVTADILPLDAE
jgi:hypothetical protein